MICSYIIANIAIFIFARKKEQNKTNNNNFNQKKFKINLSSFFTLKSKKEGATFYKSLSELPVENFNVRYALCPHAFSGFHLGLTCYLILAVYDASHEVTWKAAFFHIFIEYLALKSTFITMYNRTGRPFLELLKN